jgi:23S rRNA (guanosine2251-2'-O)-methyltransferase
MAPAGIGDRVEGIHAVAAAIAAGRVHTLHVERGRLRHDDVSNLVDAARSAGARIEMEDDVRVLASTAAPQGVVALAHPIGPCDLEDAAGLVDPSLVLVLDHLEDPRNVGAIARSALAAGVPAMVVPTRRAAPLGATAFKAAAGALEHVAVVQVSSVPEALKRLSRLGLWIVGLTGDAATSLWDFDLLTQPVAVVVGAEGSGLHRLVATRCDALVRIPMRGAAESLNASVAASLAMFEVARVRNPGT